LALAGALLLLLLLLLAPCYCAVLDDGPTLYYLQSATAADTIAARTHTAVGLHMLLPLSTTASILTCYMTSCLCHLRLCRCGVLSSSKDFFELFKCGMRAGQRRYFTYCLMRDSLRCSETGAAFFNDMLSKHAMHAGGEEEVLYAGEALWWLTTVTMLLLLLLLLHQPLLLLVVVSGGWGSAGKSL
jgi:hypothetical protein